MRKLPEVGQNIEQMLIAVEPLYDNWKNSTVGLIADQDKAIKKRTWIPNAISRLGQKGMGNDLSRRSMELASMSTSLISASDAIAQIMLDLAKRLDHQETKVLAPRLRGNSRLCGSCS